ncbi:hypothetical protein [Pseudoxanthomonas putridarboris]|uniref:Lipoprotein n=1 Tax=Pseudoxanthomonas putridarboris TaxID=752605 RepID=A0ABU9IZ99_9GAMM
MRRHPRYWPAMAMAMAMCMGLTACASDAGIASHDPHPATPFPWCTDEARAAASQPMPRDATQEQQQAVRDYHVSKACQRALRTEAEVRIPLSPPKPRP